MEMPSEVRFPASSAPFGPDDLAPGAAGTLQCVHLDLWIRESEVAAAITAYPPGRQRDDYIRTAIKIGVLALQQAHGRIDAETVRNEGERLIAAMEARLAQYQTQLGS